MYSCVLRKSNDAGRFVITTKHNATLDHLTVDVVKRRREYAVEIQGVRQTFTRLDDIFIALDVEPCADPVSADRSPAASLVDTIVDKGKGSVHALPKKPLTLADRIHGIITYPVRLVLSFFAPIIQVVRLLVGDVVAIVRPAFLAVAEYFKDFAELVGATGELCSVV